MRSYSVKVPDNLARVFEAFLQEEGKSVYQFLREAIYKYLISKGVEIPDVPLDVKVQLLEKKLNELQEAVKELQEQVKQLKQEKKSELSKYFKK